MKKKKNKIYINSQVSMTKFTRAHFQGSTTMLAKPILRSNVKPIASEESDQAAPSESSLVKNGRTHLPRVHSRALSSP